MEYAARLVAVSLLPPTLLCAFLWLDPADGAFDFSVADRWLRGEELYRDLDFFSTPASVYWNGLLLALMPRSMVTVSAALLLACLGIGAVLARIVHRETGGDWTITALFATSLMYMGVEHWPRATYTWYAVLAGVLAVALLTPRGGVNAGPREIPVTRLFAAGAMLGVAMGFKYNIGVLLTVTVLMWMIYGEWSRTERSPARLLARCGALTVGVALVPAAIVLGLYRTGTLAQFVAVVYGRSRQYAQDMAVPFLDAFGLPSSWLSVPNWMLEQVMLTVVVAGLCASLLLLLGVCRGWPVIRRVCGGPVGGHRESVVMLWAMLYLASSVTILPRADYPHLTGALPLCLAALGVFAGGLAPGGRTNGMHRWLRGVATVAFVALSVVMVAKVGKMTWGLVTGRFVVVRDYPARGMVTSAEMAAFFDGVRRAVDQAAGDGDGLLIAHPYGCFLYPYLGRRPPTSTVYFYGKMISDGDLAELRGRLESGVIRAVLIQEPAAGAAGNMALLYAEATRRMAVGAIVGGFHLLVRRDG